MAGVLNKDALLYEPRGDITHHQAVLRFRTPDVGIAVGIPFDKVKVYKGIWSRGGFVTPTIKHMNEYSRKVTMGGFYDRSIANTETEYRWIAPVDFHERLKDMCLCIEYDVPLESLHIDNADDPIISTLPIDVLAKLLGAEITTQTSKEMIHVSKFEIPKADIHQTIYYPDYDTSLYRATMTGDIFRIESMFPLLDDERLLAFDSFGLEIFDSTMMLENHIQPIGKLTPIDEKIRRIFIRHATVAYGVYSLGRFANWRNILLDDVLKDIHQINRMINQDDYQTSLESL